jgi:hypothetical protein
MGGKAHRVEVEIAARRAGSRRRRRRTAYQNAAQFLAAWNAPPSDQASKNNLEQGALNQSPAQDVQLAATLKINLQMQTLLNTRVNQAQDQIARANALAQQTQAAAQGAANVDRFMPAVP